jgi:hypothetical protein
MKKRISLMVVMFLLVLTTCHQSAAIKIDEYQLVSAPEVQDLKVYFEVIGDDSQEILASRQQFTPSHQLVEPVYINDDIVSVETLPQLDGDHIEIYIGEEQVYQAILADLDGNASVKPWEAEGHWFIEIKELDERGNVKGNIVRDGQGLNAEQGYAESYGFAILEGKPFYLYERDGQIGYSYAGEEHELGYDEVIRYRCCNDGFLNPYFASNGVSLFACRESQWYYVEIRVET